MCCLCTLLFANSAGVAATLTTPAYLNASLAHACNAPVILDAALLLLHTPILPYKSEPSKRLVLQ